MSAHDDLSVSKFKNEISIMLKINKPTRKIILAVLYVAVFMLGVWLPLPKPKVLAAGCYGSSCWGLNPNTMGCSAYTYRWKTYSGGKVESRFSSNCNALWERTKNVSGGSRYAAGSERYGGYDYNYAFNVSSPAKIGHGAVVYTAMVAPGTSFNTLSCGRVSNYGPISTNPYLTYWCPGRH